MSNGNGFSARINYQNASDAQGITAQPSIDRARGGIMKIRLVLPPLRLPVIRGRGYVQIPRRVCEFEIDLEHMPLVDVAGYRIEERQVAPDVMPYPNGVTNPYEGTFNP